MQDRMPFGKFKGWLVSALPGDYLDWLVNIKLSPWLRRAVETELEHRGDYDRPQPAVDLMDLPTLIRQWHREMAMKFHPDRDGSNEAMQAINHAHDRLRELLGD